MSVGLHLCDDLMFESRVSGTAQHLDVVMRTARKGAEVPGLLQKGGWTLFLVDLQFPGLMIEEFAALAKTASPSAKVIGYGSHVAVATLKKARENGFDLVLPRSKFVEDLPTQLRCWIEPSQPAIQSNPE